MEKLKVDNIFQRFCRTKMFTKLLLNETRSQKQQIKEKNFQCVLRSLNHFLTYIFCFYVGIFVRTFLLFCFTLFFHSSLLSKIFNIFFGFLTLSGENNNNSTFTHFICIYFAKLTDTSQKHQTNKKTMRKKLRP